MTQPISQPIRPSWTSPQPTAKMCYGLHMSTSVSSSLSARHCSKIREHTLLRSVVKTHTVHTLQKQSPKSSSAARLKTRKSFLVAVITAAHPGQRFGNHCFVTIITFLSVIATKKTKPQGHPALFGKPPSYTQNNLQWKISLIRCVTLPICAD